MPKTDSRLALYIAEEQQILREAYQSFFLPHPHIEVVGLSGDTDTGSLAKAVSSIKPRVLLLGIRILQPEVVDKLHALRQAWSATAIVLLSAYYDVKGISALRQFSMGASVGCAYLLKHTIDTVDQLTQVIYSVSEGRIILDPIVMEGLISTTETKGAFLKDLSPRELEVLSWMSKGYRNSTIAEILCLEPKTVERHINNIYSKLGHMPASKDQRVHSITLYLRGTGQLPEDDWGDDS
ncbi:MAG: response regulator transcription factor [Dehalococcoidia bacterium]